MVLGNLLGKIKSRLLSIYTQKNRPIYAKICTTLPSEKLKGKKIIVTGGGKGLGFAMAKKFVEEGAEVLITGRDQLRLKNSAEKIGCNYLCLDMKDINSFDGFIEKAEEVLKGVNCLVNNAGISLHERSFFDVTEETYQKQFETNFKGTFFLTQSFIKNNLLKNRNEGNIIVISSETGLMADIRPYGYTKAALNSMVEGLAYMFGKNGIRINAIAPGITASEMTNYDPKGDLYCKSNILNRVYLPEEVAEIACFLLSDVSSCLSGQILVCNNGKTINSRIK